MARLQLTDPNNILTIRQVEAETWPLRPFTSVTACTEDTIVFLAERRLLKNTSTCNQCNIFRNLIHHHGSDGVIWRCGRCKSKKAIRHLSFFSGSHEALPDLAMFMYCWARDYPLGDCSFHAGGMNPNTQSDWGNFCRDVCAQWLLAHPSIIGGDTVDEDGDVVPAVVEIDETYVFHRKYHRGRLRPGAWIFGGIQRDTGLGFLTQVPDRTRATLEGVIHEYILPGTHIISDGWRAYHGIDQIQGGVYTHSVVIHDDNFVDPIDREVHTQNVENMYVDADETKTEEAIWNFP